MTHSINRLSVHDLMKGFTGAKEKILAVLERKKWNWHKARPVAFLKV